MVAFFNGISTTASFLAAVLFLRFWRETDDRLFAWLALGFGLLAANWAALSLLNVPDETRHLVSLVRLSALLVVIGGIVDKNLSEPEARRW
jgi:hypothetical protein